MVKGLIMDRLIFFWSTILKIFEIYKYKNMVQSQPSFVWDKKLMIKSFTNGFTIANYPYF